MEIEVLQSEFKDWNEDLKAKHGITPIPAGEHPKLELLPQVCSQLLDICEFNSVPKDASAMLMEQFEKLKPLLAAEKLTAQNTEHINGQLQLTAAGALLSIQKLCRQMERPVLMEQVVTWLQSEYKPHQDRGFMRTKAEDIRTDIKAVTQQFQASGIRTLDEQKALLNSYLKLALDCVKAQMFLALEAPSVQEQTENFIMTM